MTASECYYNRKVLRNMSTSFEDCFQGAVKSDKKENIFFYYWYENFKPFGCRGCGWFWMVLDAFGWLYVL